MQSTRHKPWLIAYWVLFVGFLAAAALNMAGVSAGFATSHMADLVGPAWLYIAMRSLQHPGGEHWLGRFVPMTPEVVAITLFVGSTITELSQRYWPRGIFPGTYDPADILAFAFGVGVCYAFDRATVARTS